MRWEKVCCKCGKKFMAGATNAKYCPECRGVKKAEYNSGWERIKLPIVKKCQLCGKNFEINNPKRSLTKYCPECRKKRKYSSDDFRKKVELKPLPEKKPVIISIAQMELKARELGVSYGKLDLMMRQGKINF